MKKGFGLRMILFLTAVVLIGACKKEQQSPPRPLALQLSHYFEANPLQLNLAQTNAHGEAFTPTAFKYYLSGFSLITADGMEITLPESYFLVDEKETASKRIGLSVAGNTFKGIKFWIGVDSARNVSGVQEGALDPANGMFWTWSTGYIMAKLEGKSPVSKAPLNNVTFHIGGFRTTDNSLRQVSLNFPTNLNLQTNDTSKVLIRANAGAWFKGAHDIRIADSAFCMTPGVFAQKIADNYSRMFTVTEVVNF